MHPKNSITPDLTQQLVGALIWSAQKSRRPDEQEAGQ
jgi:hypothetical protein